MTTPTYVPVLDPALNDGQGGYRCGGPDCGTPYWMDTPTHAFCINDHVCHPDHVDKLYELEV